MQKFDAGQITDEARSWVGTPYRHQARLKRVGVDCVGLILGVGIALEVLDWTPAKWAPFAAYSRTPNPHRMRKAMQLFLIEVPAEDAFDQDSFPKEGLIAWMQWRDELPMHLGIIGRFDARPTLIHAFEHLDHCVEHGFVDPWPDRVESFWRYPGMVFDDGGSGTRIRR